MTHYHSRHASHEHMYKTQRTSRTPSQKPFSHERFFFFFKTNGGVSVPVKPRLPLPNGTLIPRGLLRRPTLQHTLQQLSGKVRHIIEQLGKLILLLLPQLLGILLLARQADDKLLDEVVLPGKVLDDELQHFQEGEAARGVLEEGVGRVDVSELFQNAGFELFDKVFVGGDVECC